MLFSQNLLFILPISTLSQISFSINSVAEILSHIFLPTAKSIKYSLKLSIISAFTPYGQLGVHHTSFPLIPYWINDNSVTVPLFGNFIYFPDKCICNRHDGCYIYVNTNFSIILKAIICRNMYHKFTLLILCHSLLLPWNNLIT